MNRLQQLLEVKKEYKRLSSELDFMQVATPHQIIEMEKIAHYREALRNFYNRKKYWAMRSL